MLSSSIILCDARQIARSPRSDFHANLTTYMQLFSHAPDVEVM